MPMELSALSPHLRFAARMHYDKSYNATAVKVTDCRLFYILEGFGRVQLDGEGFDLMPERLVYIGAGSVYTVSTESGFTLISLNFDLSSQWAHRTDPIAPRTQGWDTMTVHRTAVSDSPFLERHLFLEDGSSLRSGMEKIVDEFTAADRFSPMILQSQLKLLLLRLHRLEQPQLPPKVALVRSFIRSHYAQDLTNRQLASLAGYHEYHLNRLYTACTGHSLHEDLIAVRLNRAAALMLSTDAPLQEIAESVGFSSYPHFSGQFKHAFGSSPAQYRKRLKGSI